MDTLQPNFEPPRLRHFMRFSLRTLLTVGLLVALAGCTAHYAVASTYQYYWRDSLDLSYRSTQNTLAYSSGKKQQEAVASWYEDSTRWGLLSRDAAELAMSHATVMNQEGLKEQLPRIFEAKNTGDTLLAYELAQDGTTCSYAFLIRNDVVALRATKQPGYDHWVEKGPNASTYFYPAVPAQVQMFSVIGAMVGMAIFASMGYVTIAGLRWLYARWMFRPPGVKRERDGGLNLRTTA